MGRGVSPGCPAQGEDVFGDGRGLALWAGGGALGGVAVLSVPAVAEVQGREDFFGCGEVHVLAAL